MRSAENPGPLTGPLVSGMRLPTIAVQIIRLSVDENVCSTLRRAADISPLRHDSRDAVGIARQPDQNFTTVLRIGAGLFLDHLACVFERPTHE